MEKGGKFVPGHHPVFPVVLLVSVKRAEKNFAGLRAKELPPAAGRLKSRTPPVRMFSAIVELIVSISLIMVLPSCAKNYPLVFFRSDEYIVHQLRPHDTPADLASQYLGNRDKSWLIEEYNSGFRHKTGDFIVIPLAVKNIGGITEHGYQGVPILCYHRLEDNCSSPLCMPPRIFEQQIRYLKENGYRTLTPEAFLGFLDYSHPIPQKSVLITIDDGYRCAYDIAYPILKKHGFTATLFVYTDYVGKSGEALSWSHLREMKSAGFSIGSHTVTHYDLTQKDPGESDDKTRMRIRKELTASKRIIDRKLKQETLFLAFPYGRYNRTIVNMAKAAGYKLAVSVDRGSNPFFSDPLALKRDQIFKRDLHTFVSRLKTFNRFKGR